MIGQMLHECTDEARKLLTYAKESKMPMLKCILILKITLLYFETEHKSELEVADVVLKPIKEDFEKDYQEFKDKMDAAQQGSPGANA